MRAGKGHPASRGGGGALLALGLGAAALVGAGCALRVPVRAAPVSCPQPETREVIPVPEPRDDELHVRLELPDSPSLWRQPVSDEALERYRAAVLARIGGRYDTKLVLEGPLQRPGAAPSAKLLRETGNSRVGGRIRREVTSLVRLDVAAGFVLEAHLHNHPFMFDRKVGDRMWTTAETQADFGGEVAPSLTDVHFYRNALAETGLREIWVTNGFETVHIPSAELGKLHGHP